MKHLKKGRKLHRERDQRRALMKSLASSFFLVGRITTTEAKAKELRPFVEKLITHAKASTIARRRYMAGLFSSSVVKKVFEHAQAYVDRKGGYTRIIKTGPRKSDGTRMAILELVKNSKFKNQN